MPFWGSFLLQLFHDSLIQRRPPHPRRQLALEIKIKAGHTLHLLLPGTPPTAGQDGGGRWKVPFPSQDWLQHRSLGGCGHVYLQCHCMSVQRQFPPWGRSCSSWVAPCWCQPCWSSSFRCVCSVPDAPSGCRTLICALPSTPLLGGRDSNPNGFFIGQRGIPDSNPNGFQGQHGLPSWAGETRQQLNAELTRYEGELKAVMKKLKEEYGDVVTLKC